jgi:TPR repeat protein
MAITKKKKVILPTTKAKIKFQPNKQKPVNKNSVNSVPIVNKQAQSYQNKSINSNQMPSSRSEYDFAMSEYLKKNYGSAWEKFISAYSKGNFDAGVILGYMCISNLISGNISDLRTLGFKYFNDISANLKASTNTRGSALFYKGICYYYGYGVARNIQVAYDTFYDSANKYNNVNAQVTLAGIFERRKEYKNSLFYLNLAAKNGNQKAKDDYIRVQKLIAQPNPSYISSYPNTTRTPRSYGTSAIPSQNFPSTPLRAIPTNESRTYNTPFQDNTFPQNKPLNPIKSPNSTPTFTQFSNAPISSSRPTLPRFDNKGQSISEQDQQTLKNISKKKN